MRNLIDANVYLSFLLNPLGNSAATQVVRLVGSSDFELIFPFETEIEIRRKVGSKAYLRDRIPVSQLDELIEILCMLAIPIEMTKSAPMEIRDVNGAYLLDFAFAGDADFLISGDRDLLVLNSIIGKPRIITPSDFLVEWNIGQNNMQSG